MRQMGDLLLGALALGDVLDRGHPAARLQRPVDDLDRPAARRFRELARALPSDTLRMMALQNASTSPSKDPVSLRCCDQPLHGAAWLGHIRRQSEHLDIGLVADDDARRCIIENKALRDIVHGDDELAPLRRQPLIGQSMAPQQQTDEDGENGDNGEQNAFANAPRPRSRCRTEIAATSTTQQKASRFASSRPSRPDSQTRRPAH